MTPIEDLLRLTLDEGSSDLHITRRSPPTLRLDGQIIKLDLPVMTARGHRGTGALHRQGHHIKQSLRATAASISR